MDAKHVSALHARHKDCRCSVLSAFRQIVCAWRKNAKYNSLQQDPPSLHHAVSGSAEAFQMTI